MSRRVTWLAIILVLACSNIMGGNGGAVALEFRLPSPLAVEEFDTLALHAFALDDKGDSLPTPVYWRTLDDSILTVVDSTGLFTTSATSGAPRVQAYIGALRSDIFTLTIRPRSDTLALTVPDTLTVLAGDTITDTLGAAVLSNNPAGGVSGTSILYQVVDTASAQGLVRFTAINGLFLRATTGLNGAPSPAVFLQKVHGATAPPAVQVQVSATRPSGRTVPGSGQTFTIIFQ